VSYAFDPELVSIVELVADRRFSDDVNVMRTESAKLFATMNADVDTSGVVVEDHDIAGPDGNRVHVRTYTPEAGAAPRATLLEIHGGGFITGSIEMQHAFGVNVARSLGIKIAVVEYRLAPEHPFPAGIEDCYAALKWLHDNASDLGVDTSRVAIGGQSAGGGLSAGLALLARDRGEVSLCFQFLGIPELDHRLETPSMRAFIDTPMWSRPQAVRSWQAYIGDDRTNVSPYASPAIATDLTGLPPAYITAMEFDPLRDEAIVYAMRLMEARVPVELHVFPGTFHGSALATHAQISKRGNAELMAVLKRGLRCDD
jgi:acetyl esterase/lipase